MSSFKRLTVLYFTCILANFEFFIRIRHEVQSRFFFFFLLVDVLRLLSYHLLSIYFIFIPLSKSISCRGSLLVRQLSVLLPVLYCLDYCSDLRSLKIMKCNSYELFPSFYTVFYGNSFVFPQNFETQFAHIYKKILLEMLLKLQ